MAATAAAKIANDNVLVDIAEAQMDASVDIVKGAIAKWEDQLDQVREMGSKKGKSIAEGFGFDNKAGEMMTDMAGYMGEGAGAGFLMGFTPIMMMAGTAKGLYNFITK